MDLFRRLCMPRRERAGSQCAPSPRCRGRRLSLQRLEERLLLDHTVVRFETVFGDIDVELFGDADEAPLTVENFLTYVTDGDYVDSVIHRSVPGFVVQGGGFTFPDFEEVPTDDPVLNEFSADRSNLRGTIAMAKLGSDPDSATSQWFFNLADNSENLDNQNGGFTVFGQVLGDGMEIVDAIAAVQVYDKSDINSALTQLPLQDYKPGDEVLEENVVIVRDIAIIDQGGQVDMGNGSFQTVTFTDLDGTTATFRLRTGNATMSFNGYVLETREDRRSGVTVLGLGLSVADFDMTGTNRLGSLVVRTRGGDGEIEIDNITADGNLKSINAPGVNLIGDLVIAGSLEQLRLNDVADGHTVSIGPPVEPRTSLRVAIGEATDLTFESLIPVRSFVVTSWSEVDGTPDTFTAPAVGTFTVRDGDMGAELVIGEDGARSITVRGGDILAGLQSAGTVGRIAVRGARDRDTGAIVGGGVGEDAVFDIQGVDDRTGLSLASLAIQNDFRGELHTAGDVRSFSVQGGDFGSVVDVAGDLASFRVRDSRGEGGDLLAGARVHAGGLLKTVSVSGDLTGGATEEELVEILATDVGNVSVGGTVERARILAGTYLGEDWLVGGTDGNADTFGDGTIVRVSVGGDVTDSLIGAGLTLEAGGPDFDLAYLGAAPGRFLNGSAIGSVRVRGALTSSVELGPYGIGAYRFTRGVRLGDGAGLAFVVSEIA